MPEYLLAVDRIYAQVEAAHKDFGKSIDAVNAGSAAGRTDWTSLSKRFARQARSFGRAGVSLAALVVPPEMATVPAELMAAPR
jgi:hypothetical protein